MGRFAAHTGQEVTFDEMLNHDQSSHRNVDKLTMDGPAPLQAGPDGKYPVPTPGVKKSRVMIANVYRRDAPYPACGPPSHRMGKRDGVRGRFTKRWASINNVTA